MNHSEGTLTGYGGLELYTQHWLPEGEVKAVLAIVHGFGEYSGRYSNVVNWFVPKGYAAYAFDLRGCGRSPGQRGHINSFAEFREDVKAFLQWVGSQEPDKPLFLLGHSQGGLIVLDYVLHYPQGLTGVIASGPSLGGLPISPLLVGLARLLSSIWPGLTMDSKLDATAISRDPGVVETYVNDPLVHSLGTPRLATELLQAMEWVQAHAAEMKLPCLIVHGGADRLALPEASRIFYEQMTIADKARHEYEGYYHEVFNDIGKELVLGDVEAWLEQHLKRET